MPPWRTPYLVLSVLSPGVPSHLSRTHASTKVYIVVSLFCSAEPLGSMHCATVDIIQCRSAVMFHSCVSQIIFWKCDTYTYVDISICRIFFLNIFCVSGYCQAFGHLWAIVQGWKCDDKCNSQSCWPRGIQPVFRIPCHFSGLL